MFLKKQFCIFIYFCYAKKKLIKQVYFFIYNKCHVTISYNILNYIDITPFKILRPYMDVNKYTVVYNIRVLAQVIPIQFLKHLVKGAW